MYIKRVEITNIRSIRSLSMEFPDNAAGWHVILGDNGSGKSTLLRAIALTLIGVTNASGLRQTWADWTTKDQPHGSVVINIVRDPKIDFAVSNGSKNGSDSFKISIGFDGSMLIGAINPENEHHPSNTIGESTNSGWFSASYGPFRRFSGGDQEFQKWVEDYPRVSSHLSVFGENIALSESLAWLKDLRFKQALGRPGGELLEAIKAFVNQEGFLPHEAKLDEINDEDVIFVDANGTRIPVEDFSDGYRSILSLTFDFIRQMYRTYGSDMTKLFAANDFTKLVAPGVVMIDEVDAHLHPSWQRKIGFWFREHFPNIQFIVTTHSPLICQAAIDGSIWHLPRPGTNDVLIKAEGEELNRLLYGNVLDAYGTEFFGRDIGRSEVGREKLQRLASLNIKEMSKGLSESEKAEQLELRAAMPTTAATALEK